MKLRLNIAAFMALVMAALLIACSGKKETEKQSTCECKDVVLHYDFSSLTADGKVKDLGPDNVDAVLMNGAKIENGELVLGSTDDYLDMTAEAGKLMQGLSDYTITARYCVDANETIEGYGYFLWCFSVLEANQEKDGPYQAYRLNEQRCETSIGGWSQETGIQVSKPSETGKWVTVKFCQKAGKGELYINDVLVGSEDGFPELKDIFSPAPAYNWIGRAPFNGDKYLMNTRIDDFCVCRN